MPNFHLAADVNTITIGIFANSTSALYGITKFLEGHKSSSSSTSTEQVIFFIPEYTVLCSQLSLVLQDLAHKQSLAVVGTPTKEFFDKLITDGIALDHITLMIDDQHPEYYLYTLKKAAGNEGKIHVEYYTTGDTPFTTTKESWETLNTRYTQLSEAIPNADVDVFSSFEKHSTGVLLPHLVATVGTYGNQKYYVQAKDVIKNIKDAPNLDAALAKVEDMNFVNIVTELRKDDNIAKKIDSFLGLAPLFAGYTSSGKPLLFITGNNPFDQFYGFTVFTELMVQIYNKSSSTYTVIFVPHPYSCPIPQLTTYQTLISTGIQIHPQTLYTPPLALLMQNTTSKFGGWWDPIYYTIPAEQVEVFAGDPSYLSYTDSEILGKDYFSKVDQVHPIIPTTKAKWWVTWRIAAIAGAGALLLIILLFLTFGLVCKEKHKNEKDYVLEDAPEMGNVSGEVQ